MEYLYIAGALVAAMLMVVAVRNVYKRWHDKCKVQQKVHSEKERLAFLINDQFEVEDTNYFTLKPKMKDDQPYVLGNVLHCRNGVDCGRCGTGMACQSCPVRLVIRNSFKQHRNFNNVIASMKLYDEQRQVADVDVKVEGELVSVNGARHMIVRVDVD